MNIYMLRHGETNWNLKGLLQGHTDIPLNVNGKQQIKCAAQAFAALQIEIDGIVSSPLCRAYESAEIVADVLQYSKEKIMIEPLLIERYFGVGEGLDTEERADKYPGDSYPDMEEFHALLERAEKAFDTILDAFQGKENIIIVSHGALLYAILTAISNGKIEYAGKYVTFDPASIHLLQYAEGDIQLAKWNQNVGSFESIAYE